MMEKNNVSSSTHHHHNNRDGLLLRSSSHPPDTKFPATTSSSDFVLQWGNRKRLRCMKVQGQAKEQSNKADLAGTPPVQRTTVRIDRRVVRSDHNKSTTTVAAATNVSNGNGYLNLRQRPSSPAHRVLRNSDSATMKGHSNGVRGLSSPDRGGGAHDNKRGTAHIYNNAVATVTATITAHHNGNGNKNITNTHHHNGGGGGGGSGSSDSRKGGSSSGGSEAIPVVWPPKFVIGLTNKEKEEDFMAIKGSKLPHRPKKRAKFIQRTLNLVSPGAWLCDLTLERYEVREKKITKKRPRGLKAMGNMESDSE